MKRIAAVVFILVLFGCKSNVPVVSNSTSTVITETVHDSLIVVQADSSVVTALLACDSLNQVYIRSLSVMKGLRIKPEVQFVNQVLRVTAAVDSVNVYMEWKATHEKTVIASKEVKTETVVYKPPWLMGLAGAGGIGLLYLVSTLIIAIVKKSL